MHVLLSSYACAPHAGSEPGTGWNWIIYTAARGHQVTVLTTEESRKCILEELEVRPLPTVSFHFVKVPSKRLREATGLHYSIWQWMALREARKIEAKHPFDIIHHISYGSIHVPSQLWRLGPPVVFGPAGGGQTAPASMLQYFYSSISQEKLRTLLTKIIRHSPFHRKSISKMGAVLAANTDTLRLVGAMGRKDAELMFDTGVPEHPLIPTRRVFHSPSEPLRILWVGRMLPRKALGLSLDIFAKVVVSATLTIVGDGLDPAIVRK